MLRRKGQGRKGEVIGHVPARPFVGPTFEAAKDRLIEVVKENLVPEIRKQIEKAQDKIMNPKK
jgi:hypothetical protein